MPNLNKWPTNQLPVRQAISAAINRNLLASEGESGLENPVLNATGLTPQLYDAWSGPVASMTVSGTGSAAAAKQILQKAGYRWARTASSPRAARRSRSRSRTRPPSPTTRQVDSLVAQQLAEGGGHRRPASSGQSVDAWIADVATG